MDGVNEIAARLGKGAEGRSEADIQADVRAMLLATPLGLDEDDLEILLEASAGEGRRIDIEAGCTVIEVKRTIRPGKRFDAAVEQLSRYVRHHTEERLERHVGILTDGCSWILFHLKPDGALAEVNRVEVHGSRDGGRLSDWLETVIATRERIVPTPAEIVKRLGANSAAAQLDLADLHSIYNSCRLDPEVQVKRELWARLLKSALGAGFDDTDELFVNHTYLVLTAELLAHEVMGLPTNPPDGDVRALLEGQQFAMSGLHGVVEADFFDWPATTSLGRPLISSIARRLSRFDWRDVKHDVLKVLYESIIDVDTRRRLGEYYTPDWLAEKMVAEHLADPLNQRVLDPSCGSGTFLFWAVRRVLAACDAAGMNNQEAVARVVTSVHGMDLHPVAVTLARVTYLLALSPARLVNRDELTVPVFLGDSIRWEHDDMVRSDRGMTVRTTDPLELVEDEAQLHFPEGVLEEPQRFDRLVAELAARASKRKVGTKPPSIKGILNRHKVLAREDREAVEIAFKKLCRLHDAGRDHVWSYYIRNLVRPLTFMRAEGRVDLLLGNPPWLSFRQMPPKMRQSYRRLAEERGLWEGGTVATNQDLAGLFVARSVEQYLKLGGGFSFVMPHGVLGRKQYAGFRIGDWGVEAKVALSPAEDLSRIKPPPFVNASCVVTGVKASVASRLPDGPLVWTGKLPPGQSGWADAQRALGAPGRELSATSSEGDSPYRHRFRQGATLLPRVLVTVEQVDEGPIGVAADRIRIRSARSPNEKEPWRSITSLEGTVEKQFVRPMHVGATIVAYRPRQPQLAVVPIIEEELIAEHDERLDEFPGLAAYWRRAEDRWEASRGRKNARTLLQRIDFHRELSKQFPIAQHRVLYTKSGQHLAACRISDSMAVIDHKLYWAPVATVEEARYLCGMLNSQALGDAVMQYQARGQHNPRDFDKHVFSAGLPQFDPANGAHRQLAQLTARAEVVAAGVDLRPSWQFQKARRVIREALGEDGVAGEINRVVVEVMAGEKVNGGEKVAKDKSVFFDALDDKKKQVKSKKRSKKRKKKASLALPKTPKQEKRQASRGARGNKA